MLSSTEFPTSPTVVTFQVDPGDNCVVTGPYPRRSSKSKVEQRAARRTSTDQANGCESKGLLSGLEVTRGRVSPPDAINIAKVKRPVNIQNPSVLVNQLV